MSDTSNGEGWWIGLFFLFWMWYLFFMFVIPHSYRHMDVVFLVSLIATIFTACVIAAIIRNRPETTLKIGEVLDDDTLDIYTPVRTSKQWDIVTPIDTIEEVGKYAECPYCGQTYEKLFMNTAVSLDAINVVRYTIRNVLNIMEENVGVRVVNSGRHKKSNCSISSGF